MHGHLVSVKVSVVSDADERVDLDRLAFDQDRFKGLDSKPVNVGARLRRTGCS